MKLSTLENIISSLVASLLYMVALVVYVKSTYGLTIDINDELVLTYWGVIVLLIYGHLWVFDMIVTTCSKRKVKWDV
jgi:hypothetical protein